MKTALPMLLLASLLAGCASGALPSASASSAGLSVANSTTIPVTLVVNGAVVETVAPGVREDPVQAALPSLPWSVETRSPSGRVLSTMTVKSGDSAGSFGDAVRADLACGRLDIWSGPPMLGPTFIPDPSRPCD